MILYECMIGLREHELSREQTEVIVDHNIGEKYLTL